MHGQKNIKLFQLLSEAAWIELRWPSVGEPTTHELQNAFVLKPKHYNTKHHKLLGRRNYMFGPYMVCSPQTVNTKPYLMIPALKNYSYYSYVTLIREGE